MTSLRLGVLILLGVCLVVFTNGFPTNYVDYDLKQEFTLKTIPLRKSDERAKQQPQQVAWKKDQLLVLAPLMLTKYVDYEPTTYKDYGGRQGEMREKNAGSRQGEKRGKNAERRHGEMREKNAGRRKGERREKNAGKRQDEMRANVNDVPIYEGTAVAPWWKMTRWYTALFGCPAGEKRDDSGGCREIWD